MEVDTGASASIISEVTSETMVQGRSPAVTTIYCVTTHVYKGGVEDLESITVAAEYRSHKERLKFLVVAGPGPSLIGRDWLTKIHLDWQKLNHVQSTPSFSLQAILDCHCAVFRDELGLVRGTSAKI